jgi:hypothetical protein
MKSPDQKKNGTTWRGRRVARVAAGIAVAVVAAAGIGLAPGGASAANGWGNKVRPATAQPIEQITVQANGWG